MEGFEKFKCNYCGHKSLFVKAEWCYGDDDSHKWVNINCAKCGHSIYYNGA